MATNTRSERNLNSMSDLMNLSFDGEYNVHVVEPVTHNPVTGNLERVTDIQGNGSLVLTYDSGNLVSITKTIGSVSYVKTLSYTGTDLTGVSAWSEV